MKLALISLGTLFCLISCTPGGSTEGPDVTPGAEVSGSGEDPLAPHAWHLGNTAQSSFSLTSGIAGEDQSIKAVTNQGIRGNGIRIAVSDSGVQTEHPDLAGNELRSSHRSYQGSASNTWAPGGNPSPVFHEAHGTAVAGLINAVGWNGIGSRGVAPEAQFAGFLFIGVTPSDAKTIHQINGDFDIFNYSYGYPGCMFSETTTSIFNAYKNGVTTLRGGLGAIYVKAAGNDYIGYQADCFPNAGATDYYFGNTNTNEDQNNPYVILAGAVNARGRVASYSTPGSGLWVSSAGGEDGKSAPAMISTDLMNCAEGMSQASSTLSSFNKGENALNLLCNYTSRMNGTSSASPTLAGIIALMLEANPDLSWRDVKHILAATTDKPNYALSAVVAHPASMTLPTGYIYDYRWIRNAAGYDFSNTYGFGRADAMAAVNMAKTYSSSWGPYVETENPNTPNLWYYDSGAVNAAIPDNSLTGASNVIEVNHNYVIESVQIRLSVDHDYMGDIAVELTSPRGTTNRVMLANSNIAQQDLLDYTFLTNAFYGETSEGNWTVKVIDAASDDAGTFLNWKIKINGHAIVGASDITVPLPVSSLVYSAAASPSTETPIISFTGSGSTDVMRYEVSIGRNGQSEDVARWFSINKQTSFQVTGLTLTPGNYTAYIRAVDTSENVSPLVLHNWTVP